MVRYLIYLEDIPAVRTDIERLVSDRFDGFTLRAGYTGYYQGTAEDSCIIEILADYLDRGRVYTLAEDIRAAASQTEVLVASYPLEVESIRADTAAAVIAANTSRLDEVA